MKECVEVNTHVVQSILEAIGTQSTDSILFADWHKTGCQEGLQYLINVSFSVSYDLKFAHYIVEYYQ